MDRGRGTLDEGAATETHLCLEDVEEEEFLPDETEDDPTDDSSLLVEEEDPLLTECERLSRGHEQTSYGAERLTFTYTCNNANSYSRRIDDSNLQSKIFLSHLLHALLRNDGQRPDKYSYQKPAYHVQTTNEKRNIEFGAYLVRYLDLRFP